MNLGFLTWRQLPRHFDSRWKISRIWDLPQKLLDEIYILGWVVIGETPLQGPIIPAKIKNEISIFFFDNRSDFSFPN